MGSFFEELKRRNVVKVAAAYAAAAWLVAQIAATVMPAFGPSEDIQRIIFILLAIGFPVTVVLAWIYDLTPEGIQRTSDMPAGTRPISGRGLDFTIIGCLTVAVAFLLLDRFVWNPASSSLDSVAVIPFEVAAPDDETRYLGDGLADSLIMRLSRLQNLRVKSRSLVAGSPGSTLEIGRALDVDAVFRGRIERQGDILLIIVELIRIVDGSVLWSDRLQRSFTTLIGLDRDISAAITRAMEVNLSADDERELARESTASPGAFRLYLEGRHFWNQRTVEGLRESARRYRKAVDLDPGYALAWSGLADSYLMLYGWGIETAATAEPVARAAAQRAIDLDKSLAEPHATLGYLQTLYDRDWVGAEASFLKSLELNENYSSAHHWYAFYLVTVGKMDAALESILRARQSEPLSPIINSEICAFYNGVGRHDEAIEAVQVALLWNPDFFSLKSCLTKAYALAGDIEKARQTWHEVEAIFAGIDMPVAEGWVGLALPRMGFEEEATALYDRLVAKSQDGYVMPGIIGMVAAANGDYDRAFVHFNESLEERSLILSWLRGPLVAGMRDDPRYAELMEKAGLRP